jgi:hypothetical protein
VAKTDLPREAGRKPLDHNRLISTLDLIDREPVIVRLTPREADRESTSGTASTIGELKHQVPARYGGHEFSIGSRIEQPLQRGFIKPKDKSRNAR